MSSLFDMNSAERLCLICMEFHAKTNPCKYDTLVKRIYTLGENVMSLMKANREAVEIAQSFQKIINQSTGELERLLEIEKEYVKLITPQPVKVP